MPRHSIPELSPDPDDTMMNNQSKSSLVQFTEYMTRKNEQPLIDEFPGLEVVQFVPQILEKYSLPFKLLIAKVGKGKNIYAYLTLPKNAGVHLGIAVGAKATLADTGDDRDTNVPESESATLEYLGRLRRTILEPGRNDNDNVAHAPAMPQAAATTSSRSRSSRGIAHPYTRRSKVKKTRKAKTLRTVTPEKAAVTGTSEIGSTNITVADLSRHVKNYRETTDSLPRVRFYLEDENPGAIRPIQRLSCSLVQSDYPDSYPDSVANYTTVYPFNMINMEEQATTTVQDRQDLTMLVKYFFIMKGLLFNAGGPRNDHFCVYTFLAIRQVVFNMRMVLAEEGEKGLAKMIGDDLNADESSGIEEEPDSSENAQATSTEPGQSAVDLLTRDEESNIDLDDSAEANDGATTLASKHPAVNVLTRGEEGDVKIGDSAKADDDVTTPPVNQPAVDVLTQGEEAEIHLGDNAESQHVSPTPVINPFTVDVLSQGEEAYLNIHESVESHHEPPSPPIQSPPSPAIAKPTVEDFTPAPETPGAYPLQSLVLAHAEAAGRPKRTIKKPQRISDAAPLTEAPKSRLTRAIKQKSDSLPQSEAPNAKATKVKVAGKRASAPDLQAPNVDQPAAKKAKRTYKPRATQAKQAQDKQTQAKQTPAKQTQATQQSNFTGSVALNSSLIVVLKVDFGKLNKSADNTNVDKDNDGNMNATQATDTVMDNNSDADMNMPTNDNISTAATVNSNIHSTASEIDEDQVKRASKEEDMRFAELGKLTVKEHEMSQLIMEKKRKWAELGDEINEMQKKRDAIRSQFKELSRYA